MGERRTIFFCCCPGFVVRAATQWRFLGLVFFFFWHVRLMRLVEWRWPPSVRVSRLVYILSLVDSLVLFFVSISCVLWLHPRSRGALIEGKVLYGTPEVARRER